MVGYFKNTKIKYNAAFSVISEIISLDYLWKEIRVKGGAYGARLSISNTGEVDMSTYRDPNLGKSLDAFKGIVNFLKNLNISKEEINGYIITTFGSIDAPKHVSRKANTAFLINLTGRTEKERQKNRNDILNFDKKYIEQAITLFEEIISQNVICVVGNEEIIENNKSVFNNIRKV